MDGPFATGIQAFETGRTLVCLHPGFFIDDPDRSGRAYVFTNPISYALFLVHLRRQIDLFHATPSKHPGIVKI
jgi:hypothetical protein